MSQWKLPNHAISATSIKFQQLHDYSAPLSSCTRLAPEIIQQSSVTPKQLIANTHCTLSQVIYVTYVNADCTFCNNYSMKPPFVKQARRAKSMNFQHWEHFNLHLSLVVHYLHHCLAFIARALCARNRITGPTENDISYFRFDQILGTNGMTKPLKRCQSTNQYSIEEVNEKGWHMVIW